MGKHFLCTSACIKNKTKIKNISKRKRNLYMVKIEVPVKNSLNYKVSATYLAKKVSLKFVPLDYFMLNNKDARKKNLPCQWKISPTLEWHLSSHAIHCKDSEQQLKIVIPVNKKIVFILKIYASFFFL